MWTPALIFFLNFLHFEWSLVVFTKLKSFSWYIPSMITLFIKAFYFCFFSVYEYLSSYSWAKFAASLKDLNQQSKFATAWHQNQHQPEFNILILRLLLKCWNHWYKKEYQVIPTLEGGWVSLASGTWTSRLLLIIQNSDCRVVQGSV